jgi:hypothetical protein
VANLLLRHLVKDLGRGWIFLAQPLGEAAIDPAVLVLVGDGERKDFLFGQLGKAFQEAPRSEDVAKRLAASVFRL